MPDIVPSCSRQELQVANEVKDVTDDDRGLSRWFAHSPGKVEELLETGRVCYFLLLHVAFDQNRLIAK
jgi:hypothetical protein